MRTPWFLIRGHLSRHWVRTGLTITALTVALFLFCFLISVVTTVEAAVDESSGNRVIVQSAVSLFVELPLDYQTKIKGLDGVEQISKFQWFGAYFKDPTNYFAQFGVDHEIFFDQYARDMEIIEGPPIVGNGDSGFSSPRENALSALSLDRRAAIVGTGLVRDFGWKVGDTVPLIGTVFVKTDGTPWEFNIVGVYEPLKSNVDDRTFFFRYDYVDEALEAGTTTGPRGIGCYVVNVAEGYDPSLVIQETDAMFVNGPQKTMTSTEAAFQASFVSMMGNLPIFLGTIGGAVVFAVFFSVVNTMLMASRQRIRETGIMKALGFSNTTLATLILAESLILSISGGIMGCALAYGLGLSDWIRGKAPILAGFEVAPNTLAWGVVISIGIGFVAGLGPALNVARFKPVDALRSEG